MINNTKVEPKTKEEFEKDIAEFKYVENVFNYARINKKSLNDAQLNELYKRVVKFDYEQRTLHQYQNVRGPQFKKEYPYVIPNTEQHDEELER